VAHRHYKGTGQMHSFKGLLDNGAQDRIRIEGATGEIAWRITKFSIMPYAPGNTTQESLVQVWREEVATVPTSAQTVDFTDDELLAAAWLPHAAAGGATPPPGIEVIFDNALFVRNIWVTNTDNAGNSNACNYYIELEEVKVSAAGMAQLAVAASRRT